MNIQWFRGNTAAHPVQFFNPDKSPKDVTNYQFVLTVNPSDKPRDDSGHVMEMVGSNQDAANGIVVFTPTDAEATLDPGFYYYDIFVVDPSGRRRNIDRGRWLQGNEIGGVGAVIPAASGPPFIHGVDGWVDVRDYAGANIAQKANLAFADQASRPIELRATVRFPNGTHDLSEPIVLQSDIRFFGTGREFLRTQFRTDGGDFPLFQCTVPTTRITCGGFVLLPQNNILTAALDITTGFIFDFHDLHMDPSHSSDTPRKFIKIRNSDSIRFHNPWLFGQRGVDGNLDYMLDTDKTCDRIDFIGGNIESESSIGFGVVRAEGCAFHGTQFERMNVYIGERARISGNSGGDVHFVVLPDATDWGIDQISTPKVISIGSLFGSISGVSSISTNLIKHESFEPVIRSSAGRADRIPVTPGAEYFVSALYRGAETTATNTGVPRLTGYASDVAQQVNGWFDSATISDAVYGQGMGYAGNAVRHFFARGYTGLDELEIGGPGWPVLKAWANELARGSFRDDAGAFSSAGWLTVDTTIAEAPPWHVSQNYTFTGTFTSSGTAVTGSSSAFDSELKVGDWLYSSSNAEWRQIAGIGSATGLTLSAAFTADVAAGEAVDVGQSWAELQAANETYGIYQDMLLQAGKHYLAIARVALAGDSEVALVHGSSWNGSNDVRPVYNASSFAMPVVQDGNQPGKVFDSPSRLPDGSGYISLLFSPTYRSGSGGHRISLGNISVDSPNYIKCFGVAVVELG